MIAFQQTLPKLGGLKQQSFIITYLYVGWLHTGWFRLGLAGSAASCGSNWSWCLLWGRLRFPPGVLIVWSRVTGTTQGNLILLEGWGVKGSVQLLLHISYLIFHPSAKVPLAKESRMPEAKVKEWEILLFHHEVKANHKSGGKNGITTCWILVHHNHDPKSQRHSCCCWLHLW